MILKAELIKVVNTALHRKYEDTDLDNEIMSALKDLSQRGNFLDDEFERKTKADVAYYSLPENFKEFQFIGLMSSDRVTRYKPLVYERFTMYQRNIFYSNTTSTPRRYTWQNEFMYIRPTPDKEYIMFFFFSIFHPEKLTVNGNDYKGCDYILFNNIYRKAIELRLCYEVALSLDLDDDVTKFNSLYLMDELPKLRANLKEHAKISAYRDGF
ncbi:hypothetical protein ES708_14676 [subsurface metagenome]